MNQEIEIYIEELVLHGFSPHDRHRINDAIQLALQDHFTNNGLPTSLSKGGFLAHIDAGSFEMQTHKAGEIGASIAGNIYNGFSNED